MAFGKLLSSAASLCDTIVYIIYGSAQLVHTDDRVVRKSHTVILTKDEI